MNTNTDNFVMVDDNVGLTNCVEKKDINTLLTNTFKSIASVLLDHCGPYGKFAMLTRTGAQVAEPVFTKDGIGIVRAMQYASPIQDFVKNTMAYMGSRIETAAGDGTTSSMVMLAKGIAYLRENLEKAKVNYTFFELQSAYSDFLEEIIRKMKDRCFTLSSVMDMFNTTEMSEVVGCIAYCQTWTSSHGNKCLARAVADVFSTTPRSAWNCISIEKSKIENDKPYFVEYDNSQYSIQNVTIWPESAKTEDLGLSRVRDNARVLLSPVPPGTDTVQSEDLFNIITMALENNESLTVVCPRGITSETQNNLVELFKRYRNNDVCLFIVNDDDPRLNDIVCMKALANNYDFISDLNLSYRYEKGELVITSGLYENEKDSIENPNYNNEDYVDLRKLVEYIDKVIVKAQSEVSNRRLNEEIRRLKKFRLKLTLAKRCYFKIGGAAYDNAAAVDVVLDAILATKHSLDNGFCFGGNKGLYMVLKNYIDTHTPAERTKDVIQLAIASAFLRSIYEIHQHMLNEVCGKVSSRLPEDYFSYSVDITNFGKGNTLEQNCEVHKLSIYELNYGIPLIIQPVNTDIEFLKRFGELALKFIYTDRIIVDGGMCGSSLEK